MKRMSQWALCLLISLLLLTCPRAAVSPSSDSCRLRAQGKGQGVICVSADITQEVDSYDDYYYLWEVNASNDKLVRLIDKKEKDQLELDQGFHLQTREDSSYPMLKYCLAVKTKKGSSAKAFARISNTAFVSYPERATLNSSPYKRPATKKGLQGADMDYQNSTKSRNCFLNLTVSTLLSNASKSFEYQGETYSFNPLLGISHVISQCNQQGIGVTIQLMLDAAAPKELMANGGNGGAHYYAWKVKDSTVRTQMDAMFCYLAQIFGQDSCHVDNWILGNEINSSHPYYYMGQVSLKEFMENYALTFRDLYNAVRSQRGSSQVYICLEHCWTIKNQTQLSFPGKQVLAQFHSQLEALQEDVEWNLAYHPYPDNFKDPRFWKAYTEDSENADIFTMMNIKALTRYLQDEYGRGRSLILSEIGYNAANSEDSQAAAIALSYYIAACNPVVDAIIFRSFADEASDGALGLKFGIQGRKAFSIFKAMDTKKFLSKTQKLMKKQVGSNWKKAIPGYKASYMYRNFHD